MQNMSTGKTALGLDNNIGALLCYIPICGISLIYSIIVLATDKTNKLPRFHAVQSLLLLAAYVVVAVGILMVFTVLALVSQSTAIASVGYLLYLALIGVFFLALIFCAIKAYQGQLLKLPVIGDLANKWSN